MALLRASRGATLKMMDLLRAELREKLRALADEKYRAFSQKLIPEETRIIGVRVPLLREFAKAYRGRELELLATMGTPHFMEEIMVDSFLYAQVAASMPYKNQMQYLEKLVPLLNNWALCDTCCASLKYVRKQRSEYWPWLCEQSCASSPWSQRFAVVMMLNHYLIDSYRDAVLELMEKVSSEHYYVSMAVAWAISICYIKYPSVTIEYVKNSKLPTITINRAIRKIRESRQVNEAEKEMIALLKRS